RRPGWRRRGPPCPDRASRAGERRRVSARGAAPPARGPNRHKEVLARRECSRCNRRRRPAATTPRGYRPPHRPPGRPECPSSPSRTARSDHIPNSTGAPRETLCQVENLVFVADQERFRKARRRTEQAAIGRQPGNTFAIVELRHLALI